MPTRPPKTSRAVPRKAWVKRKDIPDTRIRGRRGQELRHQRLADEPLCRHCHRNGRVTQAAVPDHIIPLAFGGEDIDTNIQCLCDPCHAKKSAFERAGGGGASNHPDWLRPSRTPLTILCGPPCSGKTTYTAKHAGPQDIIIDLDAILMRLHPGYSPWTDDLDSKLLDRAVRVRNDMLGSLSRLEVPHAWLIVAAPTPAEREWWRNKLGGEILLLHPGVQECKRRAVKRGTPGAVEGINRWEHRAVQPWRKAAAPT